MMTENDKETINKLIKQHLEIKQKIDALNDRDKVIKSEIEYLLKNNELTYIEDDKGNIAKYIEQTRTTLDKKKVKELLGEINYGNVIKTTTFGSVRILSKESNKKINEMLKNK